MEHLYDKDFKHVKSLYNEDCRHTDDADSLHYETVNALRSIFDKYLELGYSPREISHIMQSTVYDFELAAVLK